jgi:hypothetical protein
MFNTATLKFRPTLLVNVVADHRAGHLSPRVLDQMTGHDGVACGVII